MPALLSAGLLAGTASVPAEVLLPLAACVGLMALLYSSVGHGGGSGYLAVMSLFGLAPAFMRPTALLLNILVAGLGSWQFARAGHFRPRLFFPFALAAVPAAFLGGAIQLPLPVFQILVGAALLWAALRLALQAAPREELRPPGWPAALATGAAIGLLSGLIGIGGGVFLTPVLLLQGWAVPRTAGAVSAVFILVNSMAALAGHVLHAGAFPLPALGLVAAAGLGGGLGSFLGSRLLSPAALRRLLALVLLVAGGKMLLQGVGAGF